MSTLYLMINKDYEIEEYLIHAGITQNELGRITGAGATNMSDRNAKGYFVVVNSKGKVLLMPPSAREAFE